MDRPITLLLLVALYLGILAPIFANDYMPSDTLQAQNLQQNLTNMQHRDAFVLEGLNPGNTYALTFRVTDPNACLPFVTVDTPHKRLRENTWQVMFYFRATNQYETFRIEKDCADLLPNDYFVSSKCVDCPSEESAARSLPVIRTEGNIDPDVLVRDVFIGGGCFDVDNISFSGPGQARGVFFQGMESINMEEGVILATGNVRNAEGPNNDNSAGNAFNGVGGGDPDLRQLLPPGSSAVTDVAILEFDFTPTTDEISFEYVFASEEYCEFVGDQFNDVFGFFISGPGINGTFTNDAINIATIPGTQDFVSINSVNWSENDNYYRDNVSGLDALFGGCRFGEVINGRAAGDEIQYDGFTTVLTAMAQVIPCETYHIKLAIGDVGDQVFDSAVFLKANSFNLGDPAELAVSIPEATFPDSNLVYESCQQSYFVFKRTEDSDISQVQVVPFSISDLSTATAVEDYFPIVSPIVIPAGQDSVLLPVLIYADDIDEGPETIIFELETACTCENILTELTIIEPEPFEVEFADISTCPGGTINLSPTINGGVSDFSYEWSDNSSDAILTTIIESPTTFTVTVTDNCGLSAEAEATVSIEEQKVVMSGNVSVCNGETQGQIELNFTGTAPFTFDYTFNGENRTLTNISTNNFVLPVDEVGVYEAVRMFSGGCEGEGEGVAELINSDVVFELDFAGPRCADSNDGFINVEIPDGNYVYVWNNGSAASGLSDLGAGTYSVEITNELGCSNNATAELSAPNPILATLTSDGIVNCNTPNGASLQLEVEGGSPGYIFDWNNGLGNIQNPSNLGGGIYKVNIQDAFGCQASATIDIPEDFQEPTIEMQTAEAINCINREVTLSAEGTSVGTEFSYNWTTYGGNIAANPNSLKPIVNREGIYELVVTNNSNGCSAAAQIEVTADLALPDFQIETPQVLNCAIIEQELIATFKGDLANYSATWSSTNGSFISEQNQLSTTINAPGLYDLAITNLDNGCINTVNVFVEQDIQTPIVSVPPPLPITCDRMVVSLNTSLQMPEEDYDFAWQTTNGNFSANRNTLNPSVNQPGDYLLTVRSLENQCETIVETAVLIDTIAPTISAGTPFTFTCEITSAQLEGLATQNNLDFEWSTEDGNIIGGASSLSPLVNSAGSYILTATNRTNGCIATDAVLIEDDANRPLAAIGSPNALTCTNPTVILDASSSSTGANFSYRWETLDGNILDESNPLNPVVNQGGFYQLFVLDASNNCEGKRMVEVLYDTITPVANITAPEVLNCTANEVVIDGSNSDTGTDFAFLWQTTDGNITSKTDIVSPTIDAAGTYTLAITNLRNGCQSETSLIVREEKPEALEINLNQPACFGDRGQAAILAVEGGIGPYQYSIDGGNSFFNDPRFGQLPAGFYNLVVRDLNGCAIEEIIEIQQPDELIVSLENQLTIGLGDSISLEAITNIPTSLMADISWTPATALSCDDCLNPMAKPFSSQEYEVSIIDQNGCNAAASIQLIVDQTPQIFVPNAFRPYNSEAGNDQLTIFAKDGLVQSILTFEIYNRWGETVFTRTNFEPNDPSLGWDGRFGRQKMRPAVFVYRADLRLIDGRTIQLKGDFTLLE